MHLDEHLLWAEHINMVIRKISKFVPIMYKIRNSLNLCDLKLIYNSLVYPNVIYCNIIWGGICKTRLNLLFVLQKKIIRAMTFSDRCASSAPLLKSLNLLPLQDINSYMCGLHVYKSLQTGNNLFTIYVQNNYNTRLANTRSVVMPNIIFSHSRQSVTWIGAQLWNRLPRELRDVQTYGAFKFKLKRWLLDGT